MGRRKEEGGVRRRRGSEDGEGGGRRREGGGRGRSGKEEGEGEGRWRGREKGDGGEMEGS